MKEERKKTLKKHIDKVDKIIKKKVNDNLKKDEKKPVEKEPEKP